MIEVRDVHKRYQTDHGPGPWVLRGISLDIPPKTNVGLIGRNGAGKTTLLEALLGLREASAGTAQLFGQPVAGLDDVTQAHFVEFADFGQALVGVHGDH